MYFADRSTEPDNRIAELLVESTTTPQFGAETLTEPLIENAFEADGFSAQTH